MICRSLSVLPSVQSPLPRLLAIPHLAPLSSLNLGTARPCRTLRQPFTAPKRSQSPRAPRPLRTARSDLVPRPPLSLARYVVQEAFDRTAANMTRRSLLVPPSVQSPSLQRRQLQGFTLKAPALPCLAMLLSRKEPQFTRPTAQ